jgi:hypothetical protein
MSGQNIWHVKIRKRGEADAIFVGTLHRPQAPLFGEVIAIAVDGRTVRAKIAAIHASHPGTTGTFEITAIEIEDEGNLPGHREADDDDF